MIGSTHANGALNALHSIFDETPVSDTADFVVSAAIDLRRSTVGALRTPGESSPHSLVAPVADLNQFFGPYERAFLAQLMSATTDTILVRGGPGTGKTSLLTFLLRHCEGHARKARLPELAGVKSFFLVFDTHATPGHFARDPADSAEAQRQVDELANRLGRALRVQLESMCVAKSFYAWLWDLLAELRYTDTTPVQKQTELNIVLGDLARIMSHGHPDGAVCDDQCKEGRLVSFLNGFADARLHFLANLLPYISLAHRLRKQKLPLLLVIDNPDFMATPVQRALYEYLGALMTTPEWAKSGLKFAIFLRLTSAADSIAALPSCTIVDHLGPNPIDLLFVKLSLFLIDPAGNPLWATLNADERAALTQKTLDLWLNLLDAGAPELPGSGHLPTGTPFPMVLEALAGGNIRGAYQLCKAWSFHPSTSGLAGPQTPVQEMTKTIRRALAGHMLRQIAADLAPHFTAAFRTLVADADHGSPTDDALMNVVARLVDAVRRTLKDFRVVRRASHLPRSSDGPRCKVGRLVADVFDDAEFWAQSDWHRSAVDAFQTHLASVLSPSRRIGRSGLLSRLCDGLRGSLEVRVTDELEEEGFTVSRAVAQIVRWLIDLTAEHNYEDVRATPSGDIRLLVMNELRLQPAVSRFRATQTLLRLRDAPLQGFDGPTLSLSRDVRTINALTVDSRLLEPIVLRVLYFLGLGPPESGSTAKVLADLRDLDFQREAVDAALALMLQADRSLIYSSGLESDRGPAGWRRGGDRALRLTPSGWHYFSKLIMMPEYIQECLSSIAQVEAEVERQLGKARHRETVASRLRAALLGVRMLCDDELRRLRRFRNRCTSIEYFRLVQLPRQGAAGDLLLQTLPLIVGSLRVDASHRSRRSGQAGEEAKLLIGEWLACAEEMIAEYAAIFEETNDWWAADLVRLRRQLGSQGIV